MIEVVGNSTRLVVIKIMYLSTAKTPKSFP